MQSLSSLSFERGCPAILDGGPSVIKTLYKGKRVGNSEMEVEIKEADGQAFLETLCRPLLKVEVETTSQGMQAASRK